MREGDVYQPAKSMWQVGWNSFFLIPNIEPEIENPFDWWEWQSGFAAAYGQSTTPEWMLV